MSRALVVGLGLIGGAAGMALRRRGWQVRYLDPNVSLDEAQRAGAADARAESIDGDDLVVLATPVDAAVSVLHTIDPSRVVTSVCGVMQPLRAVGHPRFVAGHPMTGWHEGGLANAHHVVFDGARWFLDRDDPAITRLVHDCGATPVVVDAARHDAAVALSSHLPQVLTTALFAYLSEQPDVVEFAGPGLRSFRLAGSDAAPWLPLIAANRENLAPHAEAVAALVRAILEGRESDAFAKAQELWGKLQG